MALPTELDELTPAWRELHAGLRRAVGDSAYEIWLSSLELKAWDGAVLLIRAPAPTGAWVAKRFGRTLEACARAILGPGVAVAFDAEDATAPAHAQRTGARALRAPTPQGSRQTRLNPRLTFDQFVIGDGNRHAHAAALAVAEHPGQAYNPLFLHAPPGLGKTHLLHAIGNYIVAFGAGATVRYTTAEAFTNHFIGALSAHSLDHFKSVYRDVDVLLIDDVQFLASKTKTAEEFFHTFNALRDAGRQLVLTCDRIPRHLLALEERLRERFESGLVEDIRPPDHATRLTILRKRAAVDRLAIADDAVLQAIAARITDNVRALEGALIRVVAHHSLTARPIDLALANDVLDGIAPRCQPPRPTIADIQREVSSHFGVTREALCSSSRTKAIAWPRHLAIYLARRLTDRPLAEIGGAFGGRNHATVLHACKRVCDRLTADPSLHKDVEKLLASLQNGDADRGC